MTTEDLTRIHEQNIPAMLGFELEATEVEVDVDVDAPNPDPDQPPPEPEPEPDDDEGEGDDDSELPDPPIRHLQAWFTCQRCNQEHTEHWTPNRPVFSWRSKPLQSSRFFG